MNRSSFSFSRANSYGPEKKILVVGPFPPTVGGITTFILDMFESNLTQEYTLIPFDTSRPQIRGRLPSIQDYRILFYVPPFYAIMSIMQTLYHLLLFPIALLKVRPQIAHIHTPSYWVFWENAFYVFASKVFGTKVILHIHGGSFDKFYNEQNILERNFTKTVMRLPERIIALSSYWQDFFKQIIGNEKKIVVVNNGVVTSRYSPLRTRTHDGKDRVKVLFIGGSDASRKGIYTLINAIRLVIQRAPNTFFVLIGKSEMENVEMLSKELKIEQYIKILGRVPDQEKILQFRSSDIFVLPSFSEGLPISLLEAMAAELPVISTPVGAVPEIIDEGKNGFLIQPGDSEELAEKIVILVEDSELRKEMGKNNLEKIIEKYDESITIRELSSTYRQLIGNDGVDS